MQVTVIGAGLAGCEAAWQLAQRGIAVTLHEMKPEKTTPAHHTADFAELCCSNSLRSDQIENAVGLLKEELRRLDSLILACADATRVEAGGALAVDRYAFSKLVTEKIRSHPNITVVPGEVTAIPEGNVIIASGPLTSDALAAAIAEKIGDGHTLNFFDAAAPLVTFESVDMDSAFFASRYDKGTADYINCPLTAEEYDAFWTELCAAQEAEVHGFEDKNVFEGCMPVEVMARRGLDTDEVWADLTAHDGSIQHRTDIPDNIKAVYKTAQEIDQRWILELAADRQKFIDQGQSVNLFFPADVAIPYLHACHFMAWKKGLKSLYYCRSDKLRKADRVGQVAVRKRIEDEIDMKSVADDTTCLACEG